MADNMVTDIASLLSIDGPELVQGGAERISRRWLAPGNIPTLAPDDVELALATALKELKQGKQPAAKGATPHFILTTGAPGSGKSTISEEFARMRGMHPIDTYIHVDFDTFIRYHPHADDLLDIPDFVTGKKSRWGYALAGIQFLGELVDQIGHPILMELMQGGYNLIVESHNRLHLIDAKDFGYYTSFLYVSAPLELAQKRARLRGKKTGQFLAGSLSAQDEWIRVTRDRYAVESAWYAMWAHEFIAVNNPTNRTPKKSAWQIIQSDDIGGCLEDRYKTYSDLIESVTQVDRKLLERPRYSPLSEASGD